MITLTREEAQQVLDAITPYQQKVIATAEQHGVTVLVNNEIETAIKTLRARLAQPEIDAVVTEREACAKLCESLNEDFDSLHVESCAEAIRARGQHD